MQLKEVDGQLKAYKTSIDVINGLDDVSEFQVSARVAYELQQSSSFLAENYWYLAVGSTDQTASLLVEWEITVTDGSTPVQAPIKGVIDVENGLAVLV
ncbi:MAG: hypothetical protein KME42_04255 [Tildeniella nuda ZEHNDER 1965/U140]|nr:hypothetical protein [Tildeniella nuda ZEHNDER 1965/U140]